MDDAVRYEGLSAEALAACLGLPRVALAARTHSTLDDAHALASAGAPSGTLVLADEQTGGRGRGGRRWSSPPGGGIWLALVERPTDPDALGVLSLRLGLGAAAALERFADAPVALKWPNDLYVGGGKLAGVLAEARWRDGRLEWVAVGLGVNVVAPPGVPSAAGLGPGVDRVEVLAALVPAIRAAVAGPGLLTAPELAAFAERDLARGQRCTEPAPGVVHGITPEGALLVLGAGGMSEHRAGSLVFASLG